MSNSQHGKLLPQARQLRREMTPQERKLWYGFLRSYPVKVYKQKIIDRCIVDFYCHAAQLVIEVDGSQHYQRDGFATDLERTALLESRGLKVIRFSNPEVDLHFYKVCDIIRQTIEARRELC